MAGPTGSYAAERREAAWRRTLDSAGRPVPAVWRGDWSPDSGYALGREIVGRTDVTAVFASNDQMALGLLRAAHEAGREVPGSLSVVGFDDMPESGSFWPPLTTVHQQFDQVGRAAVRSLLAAIDGGDVPSELLVSTRLVVRESSAPPSRS